MAVSSKSVAGTLVIRDEAGKDVATTTEVHGGPPYWLEAEIPAASSRSYRAIVANDKALSCRAVTIADAPEPIARTWGVVWPVHAEWSPAMEDLYSAWVEKLFDAPLADQPSWNALHDVLRDKSRNFLHDYLGTGEDDEDRQPKPLVIDPDCADMPYFLRAYFSFKMGLPFGYSSCTRGSSWSAPHCQKWHTNLEDFSKIRDPIDAFGEFLRVTLADTVHSGTGRAAAEDDNTDYYPVSLTWDSLRPGAIYADPYGHVLVIAKKIRETKDSGGVLLAVDGQPDGTVARKRFWRGNFLFAVGPGFGSPGWKRFRPVVMENGRLRQLTNQEIKNDAAYGDYSLEETTLDAEGFYDKMEDVLSPSPLDPTRALMEIIQALEEQVKTRVNSVNNGTKNLATSPDKIDMPEGAAIFETTGPWEDFSTPSRDMRLLIAIDVALGFPDHVVKRADRYAMPSGKTPAEVKADLDGLLARELDDRKFTYPRSDGSSWELKLSDVVARQRELEVAYDPNDCPEVRWGAPPRSDEMKTCRRRAPGDQIAQMRKSRVWFRERKRPPRP